MGKLNFRGYLISRFYPYSRNSRKFDAREKCVLQYFITRKLCTITARGFALSLQIFIETQLTYIVVIRTEIENNSWQCLFYAHPLF